MASLLECVSPKARRVKRKEKSTLDRVMGTSGASKKRVDESRRQSDSSDDAYTPTVQKANKVQQANNVSPAKATASATAKNNERKVSNTDPPTKNERKVSNTDPPAKHTEDNAVLDSSSSSEKSDAINKVNGGLNHNIDKQMGDNRDARVTVSDNRNSKNGGGNGPSMGDNGGSSCEQVHKAPKPNGQSSQSNQINGNIDNSTKEASLENGKGAESRKSDNVVTDTENKMASLDTVAKGQCVAMDTSKGDSERDVNQNHRELLGKSSLETHKLDLMAENSQLKLKLASAERDRQEMRDSLGQADKRISELQSRLNERTIEVTDLRNKLARAQNGGLPYTTSLERSEVLRSRTMPSTESLKERTFERDRTLDRLRRKHTEIDGLKKAVESLMTSNAEKDRHLEEMKRLMRRYRRMEEVIFAAQREGKKALDLLDIPDNASNSSSTHLSATSSSNTDPMMREPHTPVKD